MLVWTIGVDDCEREYGPKNPGGSRYILNDAHQISWNCEPEFVLKMIKADKEKYSKPGSTCYGFSTYVLAPTREKAIQRGLEWANKYTNVGPIDVKFPNHDDWGHPFLTREDYAEKHRKKLERKQAKPKKRKAICIPALPSSKELSISTKSLYVLNNGFYDCDGEYWHYFPWKYFETKTEMNTLLNNMKEDYIILYSVWKNTAMDMGINPALIEDESYEDWKKYRGILDTLGKKIFSQFNKRYEDVLKIVHTKYYADLPSELTEFFETEEIKISQYC